MTFSVLTVCTGNICRSPVAELILADGLEKLGDVRVDSAGTGALVGAGVPTQAQRLASARGIDVSQHRGRQLSDEMIRGADLVIAMTRDHRRLIVEAVPAATRYAFTLRELARIADALEPSITPALDTPGTRSVEDAWRAAVAHASTLRGTVPPPVSPDEFDVVDPYGRSDETYALSFAQLFHGSDRIVAFLTAAADAVRPR